jgi:type IV pilus assembly protein PilF
MKQLFYTFLISFLVFGCSDYNHKPIFTSWDTSNFKSDSAFYYYNLSLSYAMDREIDKAKEPMKKALFFEPYNFLINKDLGLIFQEEGDLDSAKFYLSKSISIDSTNALGYSNYGLVLYDQDSDKLAIEYYNKALLFDNRNSATFLNKALAYQQLGMLDSTCRFLDSASVYSKSMNESYIKELKTSYCK